MGWCPPSPLAIHLVGPWCKNESEESWIGVKMSDEMTAMEMNASKDVLMKQTVGMNSSKLDITPTGQNVLGLSSSVSPKRVRRETEKTKDQSQET